MNNFTFYNPTKILFGKDQIANIKNEIPKDAKVLLTYGGGSIMKNKVYDQVSEALEGYDWLEFGGIEPNPTYETLMQAVELARTEKITYLLAVGGGSVIDGTKFLSVAIPYTVGDPWDLVSGKATPQTAIEFGTVLTLPATGSEMNMGAVISKKETGDKLPLMHQLMFPQFSVLDPVATMTLPDKQVANGIVDAFVHTTEQYLTYSVNSPVQDRFAEGLLLTLIEEGPKTLKDSSDYETRANFMWTATMALNGLIGAGVPQDWATHMIGHELTAAFGLDHAQTLAVVLPRMLAETKSEKKDKLLQYAERVWSITSGSDEERMDAAIKKTEEFFQSLGVKTRLKDYGVEENQLPAVIDKLKEHGMVELGEKGKVSPDMGLQILQKSL